MISLKDKVVIITGASSGIGKAAAFEFAKQKSCVVLAARRIEKLEEIQALRQEQQELLREKDRLEYQLQSADEKIQKVLEVQKIEEKKLIIYNGMRNL